MRNKKRDVAFELVLYANDNNIKESDYVAAITELYDVSVSLIIDSGVDKIERISRFSDYNLKITVEKIEKCAD